jgi:hypothetical protein
MVQCFSEKTLKLENGNIIASFIENKKRLRQNMVNQIIYDKENNKLAVDKFLAI